MEGDYCGRDVLLHMAAWLRELACLVPDLATYGYQRGAPCDPGPDWAAWNAAQLTLPGTVATRLVAPLPPRDVVPVCCRRRVDAFAAHARAELLGSLALLVAGVLLVVLGAA